MKNDLDKNDADFVKHCVMMEGDETRQVHLRN